MHLAILSQHTRKQTTYENKGKSKSKVIQCSLPIVGPVADPGVQAVSPQVTF